MILYCYYCPECKTEWDAAHEVDHRHDEKCPECGGNSRIDLSRTRQQVSCYDHYKDGIRITDLTPYPRDEHTVHSKYEHKELFKRYGRESPAFM